METKFTKGKWILKEQGDANEYAIITQDNKWVVAFRLNGEQRIEEEKANAKLIAAAPDLFKACEEMIQYFDAENLSQCDAYYSIKNALKKATE